MKILNDVKRFFHAKYLGFINFLSVQRLSFVEFLTTHLMQCTFNMVQRLDTLKSQKTESVTLKLVDFSFDKVRRLGELKSQNMEAVTFQFVEFSAELMRNLVVLKGKDPDYVFPPPPVPRTLNAAEQLEKDFRAAKARSTEAFKGIAYSSWSSSYFKAENHPVFKLREVFEDKQKELYRKLHTPAPLQVAVASVPDPVPSVVIGQHEPALDVGESDLPPPAVVESTPASTETVVTPDTTKTVED